ncbi:UPF0725 protein EMB2204 [Raphanus sativus]|nr:UPF0725 protein EMB2204 [Raphanus sativus]
MGRGRKVKMGRRQTLKIGRRQKRRWRKVEKGRRIKNGPKDIQERHDLLMAKYIETRSKSEGFDVSPAPFSLNPLTAHHCGHGYCDSCCEFALLYARMGLHRYSLLQGKKLQLSSIKKYNKTACTHIDSYYITLEAEDPVIPGSLLTFQTKVSERRYRKFDLKCTVARLLGEKTKETIEAKKSSLPNVPELPQEDPFVEDGTNRFYNCSRIQSLKTMTGSILEVAIESTQGLGDYDAVFYIRYDDSCEARVGKDIHRVAIVRRFFDKQSEVLYLLGHNQSINKTAAIEAGSSSAQD